MILIKLLVLAIVFGIVILISRIVYKPITKIGRHFLNRYREKYLAQTAADLDSMFLRIAPSRIILINVAFTLVLGILGTVVTKKLLVGLIFALVGFFLFRKIVGKMKQRRVRKFESQLMDSLAIISNSLKAGLSLLQGIELAAHDLSPPTSEEFELILRENRVGLPLEESLLNLTKRIESDDLSLVVRAILIQQETGGDLTKIFDQVISTIEERMRLYGKIWSLTAQGRMEAITVGVLPWGVGLLLYLMQPELIRPMFREPLGIGMLALAIVWELIGIYVIRKIVRVEV